MYNFSPAEDSHDKWDKDGQESESLKPTLILSKEKATRN